MGILAQPNFFGNSR